MIRSIPKPGRDVSPSPAAYGSRDFDRVYCTVWTRTAVVVAYVSLSSCLCCKSSVQPLDVRPQFYEVLGGRDLPRAPQGHDLPLQSIP